MTDFVFYKPGFGDWSVQYYQMMSASGRRRTLGSRLLSYLWALHNGCTIKYSRNTPYVTAEGGKVEFFSRSISTAAVRRGLVCSGPGKVLTEKGNAIFAEVSAFRESTPLDMPSDVPAKPEKTRRLPVFHRHLSMALQDRIFRLFFRCLKGAPTMRNLLFPGFITRQRRTWNEDLDDYEEDFYYMVVLNFNYKQWHIQKTDNAALAGIISDIIRIAFNPLQNTLRRKESPASEDLNYPVDCIKQVLANSEIQGLCEEILGAVYPDGDPQTCLTFVYPPKPDVQVRVSYSQIQKNLDAARARIDELEARLTSQC